MGAIRSGAASGRVEGGVGEIVQVQGGHILRATGRKDRHSKVYTSKGPRDRRVRLSAHTAIQFYDVQDRLGYDRPSKAVDWLINKAKAAIDKLTELPPWHPNPNPTTTTAALVPTTSAETNPMTNRQEELESSEFVPHQIGHSAMDMVINSRSEEDLGLSLHPFQTGPVSKWGLGFGFETDNYPRAETNRDGFVYSNNNMPSSAPFPQRGTLQSSLISTEFHGFDGFGTGSEDHHKDQEMVHHQSHFLDGRFGSDGFPAGFYVPINNEVECNVGSSKAPPSFYAWSNGGHSSLMKHK